MKALTFFKQLADDTRLKMLLLIHLEKELCVCELTAALDLSQPKVSRHLAQLKSFGVLSDRRDGKWVFYSLCNALSAEYQNIIAITCEQEEKEIAPLLARLSKMGDRPVRQSDCC